MSEDNSDSAAAPSGSEPREDILPGYATIEDFTKEGFKCLMEAIRHSNALPSGRDWNFYKTFEAFPKIMGEEGASIVRSMNQILRYCDVESNLKSRVLDDKTELVVEANDAILEKVGNNIDDLLGLRKNVLQPIIMQSVSAQLPINGSWNRANNATFTVSDLGSSNLDKAVSPNCIKLITAKNIVRPQKLFKDKINNSNVHPWEPRIKEKPNSLKPLAVFLEEFEDRQEFGHPYEYELDRFTPAPEQLKLDTPIPPKPISATPLIEIDKAEQLDDLVETLRKCTEFAVDVEHHSYRTFMGITCLLQISTQDSDYIIDTLSLRNKLHVLNEVFTKNTIVKIFHGADRDIEWLQRDLSIYVVNMFDTHQAARVLEYPALSLAYLLKKFCDVNPDKQFQLADWRIRPLPDEFKKYAREDTHYLIYIYQLLKQELFAKANNSDHLLKIVFERSTEICKKRYFKPILADDSHLEIYMRSKKMFNNRQMYALKEIYAWRDHVAREEDESLAYVLPNHMLLQIAETLPREMQGILACCNPIPPLVRSNLLELHNIVLKARDQPLEKAILKENTSGRGILKKVTKINVDSPLHCPHDLTKTNEFRDDLPTLISNPNLKTKLEDLEVAIEKQKSAYSVFETPENSDDDTAVKRETFKQIREIAFLSPYERYKLVKPFVEAEEERLAALKKKEEEEKMAVESDNRTDAERIASIREHFLTMSKKFSEDLEAKNRKELEELEQERQKSLIEMGGSKKRKREESSGDESDNKNFESRFQTPIPTSLRFPKSQNKKGVKREFQQHDQDQQSPKKRKRNKKKNTQNANKNFGNSERSGFNQQLNASAFRNKKKNKQNTNTNFGNSERGGFNQQLNASACQEEVREHVKKPRNRKGRQDNSFVPYDYSSVDFRQFQGGAGSASTGAQIQKAGFKAKGRKKMGNKGTRSATFASTNVRGRGRGR